jgi:hypothetical protein
MSDTPDAEATTVVAGVELACGRFDALWADHFAMRFPPHFHDTWAIGVIEAGLLRLRTARGEWIGGQDTILAFAPGEIHSAEALTAEGYRYRMIYPGSEMMRDIGVEGPDVDGFRHTPVFTDHHLAGRLVKAHQPLMDGEWGAGVESRLIAACVMAKPLRLRGDCRGLRPAGPRGCRPRPRLPRRPVLATGPAGQHRRRVRDE